MKTKMTSLALAAVLSIGGVLGAAPALAEDIVSLPNLSYRTGPFAATGIPLMNGQRDYMTMINERDGGINGVKLGYEECETGYSTEKGVECYERTKATGIVTQPWSRSRSCRSRTSTRSRSWRRATASRRWPTAVCSNGPSIRRLPIGTAHP